MEREDLGQRLLHFILVVWSARAGPRRRLEEARRDERQREVREPSRAAPTRGLLYWARFDVVVPRLCCTTLHMTAR